MPSINDTYCTRFLTAADLKGKELVGKILKTTFEEFEDDGVKRVKPVVEFEGFPKPLALNKTNARMIARVLDLDETDDWVGKKVAVFPDIVAFGAKMVDAVRIREFTEITAPEVAPAPKKAKKARATIGSR